MSLERYQDRNEKSRQEQEEREKAKKRDAEPYDPGKMTGKMPIPCAIFFLAGALFVAVIVAEILRRVFWS